MNSDTGYQPPEPQKIMLVLFLTIIGIIVLNFLPLSTGHLLFLLAGELFIIIPALLFVLRTRHSLLKAFRIKPVKPRKLFATVLFFVPIYILTDELDRLVMHFFPLPEELQRAITEMVTFTSLPQTLLLIFTGVFIAAIVEEMLFRGLFQQSLEYYRDPAIAIVLSAVLFAILHFNPWTSLQILVLGLILGYVTWKTRSILPAVILHALNNGVSMVFINLPPEQMTWYARNGHVNVPWILFGIAAMVPAFRFFLKR
ncbi:MAG: type II CAAX endopeptidase family protein [candidate division KSB1 bacterium]|nr:type II CAAX endopeptidase family protein [candidate division KSB1 bacterium]